MSVTSPPVRKTMSVEDAAAVLGIGRSSAYAAVRSGELPSIRIGRRVVVPIVAVERLLSGEREAVGGNAHDAPSVRVA